MNIVIGSDHVGYTLKESIKSYLTSRTFNFVDFSVTSNDQIDYPIIAKKVSYAVAKNEFDFGILTCGTGVGMSIASNKIKKIRAVVCSEPYSAKMARAHNDANILCLGTMVVGIGLAQEIIEVFLSTSFEGGRHEARIKMLEETI
jgi:ribose 5-phosphate isomerase B